MKTPILNIQNISFTNSNQFMESSKEFSLSDISITLQKNSSISIIGDSASGKTSLIMALLKFIPITSGKIFYNGQNIQDFSKNELKNYRRKIQPVFQNYEESLNPLLTIKNNLVHGFSKSFSEQEKKLKLFHFLGLVGLESGVLKKYPHQLSGGEKQRITIARAMITEPEVIILDEPFSSLDVLNQEKLLLVLDQIKSEIEISYIFITHKIPLVKYFNDSIYLLKDGEMQLIENNK